MHYVSYLLLALLPMNFAVAGSWQDNKSPWPEIRTQRIHQLLPNIMQEHKVDGWVIICRENNNDPIAAHVGCENAGGTAAVLFERQEDKVAAHIFSPISEATALQEKGWFDQVHVIARGDSTMQALAEYLARHPLTTIAINSFSDNPQADGLSHTQFLTLSELFKQHAADSKLVPSESIIYDWLAIKLPQEVAIMSEAAQLTSQWQYEVYAQVIPGVTTDADVARWLKQKMAAAGVTDGWAPSQNPAVNSGKDRGHSHATDRVIQPGDVIQIDFGIRVFDRWVTDVQRFAYVLKSGETQPPANIQHAWKSATLGRDAAFNAMQPGKQGIEVDRAQRQVMQAQGSLPVMWSTGHPVGYVAHDSGPNLGGAASKKVRPAAYQHLKSGMTFAFDGFYSWPLNDNGETKTISVEEMVVITPNGAQYLTTPQQELILIPTTAPTL